MPNDNQKKTVTPKEAANALGLCERTVRNLCASGELKARKVGRKWIISAEQLEDVLGGGK